MLRENFFLSQISCKTHPKMFASDRKFSNFFKKKHQKTPFFYLFFLKFQYFVPYMYQSQNFFFVVQMVWSPLKLIFIRFWLFMKILSNPLCVGGHPPSNNVKFRFLTFCRTTIIISYHHTISYHQSRNRETHYVIIIIKTSIKKNARWRPSPSRVKFWHVFCADDGGGSLLEMYKQSISKLFLKEYIFHCFEKK